MIQNMPQQMENLGRELCTLAGVHAHTFAFTGVRDASLSLPEILLLKTLVGERLPKEMITSNASYSEHSHTSNK